MRRQLPVVHPCLGTFTGARGRRRCLSTSLLAVVIPDEKVLDWPVVIIRACILLVLCWEQRDSHFDAHTNPYYSSDRETARDKSFFVASRSWACRIHGPSLNKIGTFHLLLGRGVPTSLDAGTRGRVDVGAPPIGTAADLKGPALHTARVDVWLAFGLAD